MVGTRSHIICGIDIGSSTIRMLVAELLWNGGGLKIHGIGVGEARGIRRGVVTDIEEVSRSIRQVREQVESTLGFSIERAFVSIGGPHIVALPSRGVVAVSRADGEISREDIRRVLAAAQAVPIGSNREVLHAIPREFVVDGEQGMKNVLGMSGVRLEVEALLLQVSSPALRNLERALREAGVTAEEIVLSSLDVLRVDEPSPEDQVSSPLTVSGAIVLTSGELTLTLYDENGDEIAEDTSSVESVGQGELVPFESELEFDVDSETEACLWVWEAEDGTAINVRQVPLTLRP